MQRVLVDVELTEGTNLAVAVAPDGQRLVIALQGVLWTLDATGGAATPLTPVELDAQEPVWSPAGDRIVFYAYAGETFSIWTVRPDGTGLEEIVQAHGDARYPTFSPDGGQVLYASDADGGYSIWSVDLATRIRSPLTTASTTGYQAPPGPYFTGAGNAVYPALSPDGATLAFVIDGDVDRLVVRDLDAADAAPRALYGATLLGGPTWTPDSGALVIVGLEGTHAHLARVPIDGADPQRLVESGDIFPFRPAFAPDGALLYSADGAIRRLAHDGTMANIPFSARVTLDRTPYSRRTYDLTDATPRTALGIIDPSLSPDGSQVAFAALGDLWIADTGTGAPRRLTDDPHIDLSPGFAPDGTRLAFVSDRAGKSDIWVIDPSGATDARLARLTDLDKPANTPVWSPDGTRIAYLEDVGNSIFISATVNVLDVASGMSTRVSEPLFGPSAPAWSPDGTHIVVYHRLPASSRFREGPNVLLLLSATGDEPGRYVTPVAGRSLGRRQFNRLAWSSTGELVFRVDGELWLAAFADDGRVGPARRIAASGENPAWSADGRHLVYLDGRVVRLFDRDDDTTRELTVQPGWQRPRSGRELTVRAGRMFDGAAGAVVENVDIAIAGGLIVAVTPAGSGTVRGTLIDATDRFVMPGLIEGHTHQSTTQGSALGERYLCRGITTVRETGDDPYHALERREAEASGRRMGPRVFTAGPLNEGTRVSYGVSETVDTPARVDASVRLAAALELDLYKSYVRQNYQLQREVIARAHAVGMPVSSHELYPAVAHGIDFIEHFSATSRRGFSLKSSRTHRAYQDVIALINASGVIIVPTLALDERDGRDMTPQHETLRRIVHGGGRIVAGTDSPFVVHADALHRELEIYVEAGLAPAEALRAATGDAAAALGVGTQLGRIAPGYVADLVILTSDALEDIRAVRGVDTVLKNGEVVCVNGTQG